MAHDADPADILALRRLAEAYGRAVDLRDGSAFADVFTEDAILGVIEPGEDEPNLTYEGRAALETVPELVKTWDTTMHVMTNHYIDLDGDTGTGLVYGLTLHFRDGDGGGQGENTFMILHYRDQYVRTADGWRIKRRDVLRQWTEYHAGERAKLAESQSR